MVFIRSAWAASVPLPREDRHKTRLSLFYADPDPRDPGMAVRVPEFFGRWESFSQAPGPSQSEQNCYLVLIFGSTIGSFRI
jgi:hypothetical protein